MRRSAVILSTLSAGVLAADQQLRGSSAPGASTLASGDACSQFCCWSGSDCGSCGDEWNNRMYEEGCRVPCSGPNCGPGKAHQYFNTQPNAMANCQPPGGTKCDNSNGGDDNNNGGDDNNGGDNGNNKCLQNPQGDWTRPQVWNNDCSWMQCDGNGHNGDDCQHADDSANQCRDWNLHLGNHDVCNIPAGNGHGKIFCFGDIQDHWENGVKINDCQWLKTSGDECGADDNAQWCRDNNRDACPRQCPRGALTVTAPVALPVSKQADNLTVELASDEGCCSFDGCETCAQWCTQQGKEVCLAPQGAPGGGCDNSHSDPHAHPPQWCPTGAGAKVPTALTANDALAAATSTTCGVLPQCAALSQTQPSQCPDAGSGNCKVNSAKMCIYNPKCVSGETSLGCVVDTGCQYVDTPSSACNGNGDFKSNDCGNSQFGCYPSKGCSDGTLSEQCAAGGQPQECRYCDKGGSPSAPGLVPCPAPAPAPVQLQSP
jgi:hypothetical protein